MNPRRDPLAVAGVIAALTLPAIAQRQDDDKWREDPYTENDQGALEQLGYVAIGHMTWVSNHDTLRIEQALGRVKLRFIETEHFKLGCSLGEQKVPRDKKKRTALLDDIAELREVLPNLKKRPRRIDPWLRAHLYAFRLERHYDRVQELLGVTDDDFPKQPGEPEPGKFGRGPYLGTKSKHLVLVFEQESACDRYMSTFANRGNYSGPARHWFEPDDAFLVATAAEFGEGSFKDDNYLHAHVLFNVTHNLFDGYKGYRYLTPMWWKEGIAHVFSREVCDKPNFSGLKDESERTYEPADWRPEVFARVRHELAQPLTKLLGYFEATELSRADHLAVWSRMDYLMDRDEGQIAEFAGAMKAYVLKYGEDAKAKLLEVQAQAFPEAFGCTPDELDVLWKAWVKKTYPRK